MPKPIRIKVRGIEFESYREAARHFGVNHATIAKLDRSKVVNVARLKPINCSEDKYPDINRLIAGFTGKPRLNGL